VGLFRGSATISRAHRFVAASRPRAGFQPTSRPCRLMWFSPRRPLCAV